MPIHSMRGKDCLHIKIDEITPRRCLESWRLNWLMEKNVYLSIHGVAGGKIMEECSSWFFTNRRVMGLYIYIMIY